MPTRIEFLGVPGAGKSSLVPEATDELRRSGVVAGGMSSAVHAALRSGMQDRLIGPVIRYMPRRFGRSIYKRLSVRSQDRMVALRSFLLEYPEATIAILEALKDRRDIDPRQDLALGWIVELLWQYQLVNDRGASNSCLVLDEGFCNRALTLFGYRFSEEDEPRLRQYIEAIPKPDLVFVVTGDIETAAARATRRERFRHLSAREAVEYTRDTAACVEETARLLEKRGVEVRTVRNDSSLDAASRDVRRIIREWLDGR
jgi:adenylate kinase